jgi:hypothetical protein
MKKLTLKQASLIKGGGCKQWLRIARRTTDVEIRDIAIKAYMQCVEIR